MDRCKTLCRPVRWSVAFAGLLIEATRYGASPADPNVSFDHNDISAPVFVDFVAQRYAGIDRLNAEPQGQAQGTRN